MASAGRFLEFGGSVTLHFIQSGSSIIRSSPEAFEEWESLGKNIGKHALDLDALRRPEITFWSIWSGEELVGCGALKELEPGHGEIKSMRTVPAYRGKGAAKLMLRYILDEARRRNYHRLSLETGSMDAFEPARQLYASHGFEYCEPFADYILDPHSVFMTLELGSAALP